MRKGNALFRFYCAGLALTACMPLLSSHSIAEVDCRSSVDPTKDVTWRPVKKGIEKLHFLAPTSPSKPDCPAGQGCELPGFLVSGDQVIVTTTGYDRERRKSLICGVYISSTGAMTFGWLDDAGFYGGGNIMTSIENPKVFGRWTDLAGSDIEIHPGEKGSYLAVEGDASLGQGGNIGEFDGPAFIGGSGSAAGYSSAQYDGSSPAGTNTPIDRTSCRVRFRFTGYYLLVDDNNECGGQGISFTGVYTRSFPISK